MNLTNIEQRGDALLVRVRRNGKRESVMCGTMEEALSVRAKLRGKSVGAPAGWTIGEAYETCYNAIWKGTANEDNSVRNAGAAIAFFGEGTPLKEITTDWVDGYITKLKQTGNSNGTINRKLASLSKLFTYAIECKQLSHDDKPKLRRQKEMEGRMRVLSRTEEEQVLAYLSQWGKDDHAEVVCILVDSGLRPSELFRLEACDCDFEKGKQGAMSIIRSKNGKTRIVPMTKRVSEILKRRIEVTAKGPLFPFDKDWLTRMWARVRSIMGLDDDKEFIPYVLRHTCASRLVQRGVPLPYIQQWLGHKNILVTQRYAKTSPENLYEAVSVLEN